MKDAMPKDANSTAHELLDRVLPKGLPTDWAADRPLIEAGLDSITLINLVAELEAAGIRLGDQDLREENFASLESLGRLIASRT